MTFYKLKTQKQSYPVFIETIITKYRNCLTNVDSCNFLAKVCFFSFSVIMSVSSSLIVLRDESRSKELNDNTELREFRKIPESNE